MGKANDFSGKSFGRLTVIERYAIDKRKNIIWLCECVCGNTATVRGYDLKLGKTKSCGCLVKELTSVRSTSHGKSKTSTYSTWLNMKRRCTNPSNEYYYLYGGKGVKVCNGWLKFENFLKDMGEKPDGMTLDRVDSNGDYCLENCRWVSAKEQSRNTSRNVFYEIDGVTLCIGEISEKYSIDYQTLYHRLIVLNMTPTDAVNKRSLRCNRELSAR